MNRRSKIVRQTDRLPCSLFKQDAGCSSGRPRYWSTRLSRCRVACSGPRIKDDGHCCRTTLMRTLVRLLIAVCSITAFAACDAHSVKTAGRMPRVSGRRTRSITSTEMPRFTIGAGIGLLVIGASSACCQQQRPIFASVHAFDVRRFWSSLPAHLASGVSLEIAEHSVSPNRAAVVGATLATCDSSSTS